MLRLPSQQFPADTARQRGWWEPHLQRRHLARASHPAHCAPNMLREAGETLFWLGTCHGGCPWARQAEQEVPRCHGFASTPVPAGDRLDLSPRGASASQPASRHPWGKQSPLQPHPKMPARSQQPASQSLDTLPAFRWLQEEDTQISTKPHQQEVNLFKQNK